MILTTCAQSRPFSQSKRSNMNTKNCKLNSKLKKKIHKAMIVCDPNVKKDECEVLWNDIEEISKDILLLKQKKRDLNDLEFDI